MGRRKAIGGPAAMAAARGGGGGGDGTVYEKQALNFLAGKIRILEGKVSECLQRVAAGGQGCLCGCLGLADRVQALEMGTAGPSSPEGAGRSGVTDVAVGTDEPQVATHYLESEPGEFQAGESDIGTSLPATEACIAAPCSKPTSCRRALQVHPSDATTVFPDDDYGTAEVLEWDMGATPLSEAESCSATEPFDDRQEEEGVFDHKEEEEDGNNRGAIDSACGESHGIGGSVVGSATEHFEVQAVVPAADEDTKQGEVILAAAHDGEQQREQEAGDPVDSGDVVFRATGCVHGTLSTHSFSSARFNGIRACLAKQCCVPPAEVTDSNVKEFILGFFDNADATHGLVGQHHGGSSSGGEAPHRSSASDASDGEDPGYGSDYGDG